MERVSHIVPGFQVCAMLDEHVHNITMTRIGSEVKRSGSGLNSKSMNARPRG